MYKVKVKCTLAQALRLCTGHTAHRESLYPFMATALEGGEGSASRPGRSLPLGKTRYPLYRRLGGPQGRYGQVRKISPPTGIRSPDRPARSQSLYRLRYLAHQININRPIMTGSLTRNDHWHQPITSRYNLETSVIILLYRTWKCSWF